LFHLELVCTPLASPRVLRHRVQPVLHRTHLLDVLLRDKVVDTGELVGQHDAAGETFEVASRKSESIRLISDLLQRLAKLFDSFIDRVTAFRIGADEEKDVVVAW
ncbi:hypothetical protein PMAYCL1PPCAC_14448, partial [Pristionchus mayeri]